MSIERNIQAFFCGKIPKFRFVLLLFTLQSGPVGVGKSYLLYMLASELRLNRQCRVTYINDCAAWRCNDLDYILNEFVTTFYDDADIVGKDIVQWCHDIDSCSCVDDKKSKMLLLIRLLLIYTREQQLEWFFICDQLNALYSEKSVAKDFPYNLITELSKKRGKHVRVIVSASVNNEGYPTDLKKWFTHHLPTHRYDDDEFAVWCENNPLADNILVDPNSAAAADALYWSGWCFFIHVFCFILNSF
jgi:hypothetical protein